MRSRAMSAGSCNLNTSYLDFSRGDEPRLPLLDLALVHSSLPFADSPAAVLLVNADQH